MAQMQEVAFPHLTSAEVAVVKPLATAFDQPLTAGEKSMETMPAGTTDVTQAEVRLSGRGISPGLGMGRAWVFSDVPEGEWPAGNNWSKRRGRRTASLRTASRKR